MKIVLVVLLSLHFFFTFSCAEIAVFKWQKSSYLKTIYGQKNIDDFNVVQDVKDFLHPIALAIHKNRLYILDIWSCRIQIYDISEETPVHMGTLAKIKTFGEKTRTVPTRSNEGFWYPYDISIDNEQEKLYVADTYNHRIQIYDLSTGEIPQFEYTIISEEGKKSGILAGDDNSGFDYPTDVLAKNGKLYVSDRNNKRIQIFDITTKIPKYLYTLPTIYFDNEHIMTLAPPISIEVKNNKLYVTNGMNLFIRVYDISTGPPQFLYLLDGGSREINPEFLDFPKRIFVDSTENKIYIADTDFHVVRVYKQFKNFLPKYETIGSGFKEEDPIKHKGFNEPLDVLLHEGIMYIADTANHRVQIYKSPKYKKIQKAKAKNLKD